MNKFLRILSVLSLSAFCAVPCVLCGCNPKPHNEPTERPLPEIEYTIDESVLDTGRDANATEFYASAVERKADSPLFGKTIYWLGSSVTYGASSSGEAMAEYLAAMTGAICKKDAVSSTTIFDDGSSGVTGKGSYTRRLTTSTVFDKNDRVDAFICQISTNDSTSSRLDKRVVVEDKSVVKKEQFDRATTLGGVEYIIAYAIETWNCPVYFYSGSYFGDVGENTRANRDPSGTNYSKLIDDVKIAVDKWQSLGYDVDVIDMYNDKDFNAKVSDAYYKWCTSDPIHPKKAGYLNWWTPYFEQFLIVKSGQY